MIEGSGFSDILKAVKTGVQKFGSAAVPYVKNQLKKLIPGVRSDINAGVNSGVNFVANQVRSGLNPLLGYQLTNELVDKGVASVKGFAKEKLDAVQSTLQGMGMKKGEHYKLHGGKLSLGFLKSFVRPIAEMAVPALATVFGGPTAGLVSSAATDALLDA